MPWADWHRAAGEAGVDVQLRAVYEELAAEIARRNPTCWISGKCCKFDEYGHRLYVTGLEIAWMLRQLDAEAMARLREADLPGSPGCPFQVKKMCSVQGIKPLGCRIFFCDPSAESWMNEVYEQFLVKLRQMHAALGLDYRYVEWRQGLAEARAAMGASGAE
jgi:Fe-S-cluster containining protein